MKYWISSALAVTMTLTLCGRGGAETPSDNKTPLQQMQKQIDTMQDQVDSLQLEAQKGEPIRPYSAKNFTLGGYTDMVMTSFQRSGTDRYTFEEEVMTISV